MFQVLVTISTAQKVLKIPLEENPGVKVVEVIFLDDELDQLVAHDEGEDDASDGDNHRFREVSDHVEDAAVPGGGRHADLPGDLAHPLYSGYQTSRSGLK